MDSKDTKSTGEKIRILRQAAGFTQKQLSDKTKISLSAIGKYEIGERIPKYDTLLRIAKVLNVSFFDLIDENFVFNKDVIDAISTEETKKISNELQNKVNKVKTYVEKTEEILRYLGFEIKIKKNSKFNPNSFLNINTVYLAYKNISCNLDDVGYNNLINDIYKSIRGMTFNYIIKGK